MGNYLDPYVTRFSELRSIPSMSVPGLLSNSFIGGISIIVGALIIRIGFWGFLNTIIV